MRSGDLEPCSAARTAEPTRQVPSYICGAGWRAESSASHRGASQGPAKILRRSAPIGLLGWRPIVRARPPNFGQGDRHICICTEPTQTASSSHRHQIVARFCACHSYPIQSYHRLSQSRPFWALLCVYMYICNRVYFFCFAMAMKLARLLPKELASVQSVFFCPLSFETLVILIHVSRGHAQRHLMRVIPPMPERVCSIHHKHMRTCRLKSEHLRLTSRPPSSSPSLSRISQLMNGIVVVSFFCNRA